MKTLRELAQAAMALDKDSSAFDFALWDIQQDYGIELGGVEGLEAFLAALDAERTQGYARAMGEVVEHASQQSDECHETRWDPCVMGRQDAWDDCYEWARERLPAAAEKEHGG